MEIFLSISHRCLDLACQKPYIRYWQYANDLMYIQNNQLKNILRQQGLPALNYTQFTQQFPLTNYPKIQKKIEQQILQNQQKMGLHKIQYYQTERCQSGLTKFIPYTQPFIDELDCALSLWIVGLYQQYPELKKTTHYWQINNNAKLEYPSQNFIYQNALVLNVGKRILNDATRAVPMEVGYAQSAADRLFATAVYLVANKDLGLISVWNPRHALDLLDTIRNHQKEMIRVLRTGQWRRKGLNYLKAPRSCEQSYTLQRLDLNIVEAWQVLWPKLILISSRAEGEFSKNAENLKLQFPSLAFEEKGLWCTEGVVSVAFQGRHPLAYQSHFYEFIELKTQQILPAWRLNSGDIVCPVISTSAGLFRYVLNDVLEVTDFYMKIPCLKNLGQHQEQLFADNKVDAEKAKKVLAAFKPIYAEQCLSEERHISARSKIYTSSYYM